MKMSSITGFGMKDCLSLPSLGWKHFMSSRCVDDEPIYSYTDKYMRHFVRQQSKVVKLEHSINYTNHKFLTKSSLQFQTI